MDFSGHGKSSHRSNYLLYSIVYHAFDVVAVADALRWSEFSLVGHSMGGVIATLVASAVPERVQSLVMIDSVGPGNTLKHTRLCARVCALLMR
jgi:pimeloyl-ACP methyl ester carboxylesterase